MKKKVRIIHGQIRYLDITTFVRDLPFTGEIVSEEIPLTFLEKHQERKESVSNG